MKKIKLLSLALIISLSITSCMTDDYNAKRVLETQGYTNIELTGYDYFGCSDDDFYSTGFKAKSINGNNVEGVFCSSVLSKGGTIRLY